MIDAHIHLDLYEEKEMEGILDSLEEADCTALISPSFHLASCRKNKRIAEHDFRVFPAYGFHPEQELPSDNELQELLEWIRRHQSGMIAVGEIGLPYYLREEKEGRLELGGYMELLEEMIKLAKELDKPVILHAVYDDAPAVCDLLEKYSVDTAHFHWFKGDEKTVERMAGNGYFVSFTPDIGYEPEIRELAVRYPLEQMMVETDGPWPFDGPFSGKRTHPAMIHHAIREIAGIKRLTLDAAYETLFENTAQFYRLKTSCLNTLPNGKR